MSILANFSGLEAIVSLLYSPVCTVCATVIGPGEYLCRKCEEKAARIVPPFCARCSEPFEGAITGQFTCANCAHRTIHFDAALAAYRSRGIAREIIHDFKYGRQIYLRHLVARWLGAALDDPRLRSHRFDVIVPVPLHPARERERGFNQASLLAELLAARVSIPFKRLLERIRYTTTQTALDRAERMENLHNAFPFTKKHRRARFARASN
jgi:competence protein ComFC